uniref:helix-turn-helix domain-containing protein n=2 Tax=Bifidobacterium longum TaxID=216816 RepID=UPI00211969F5
MGQQYSHLSSEERILIEKLHCEQHLSIRKIAEEIGRDKSTVSRELRRGLWFASNENGSYRPYRPKRLKTGPWTSGPFYSALAAQRCISSSRCFVFSHVFFSGLGSCMHFPYFSGCAEVFLPNMRASL